MRMRTEMKNIFRFIAAVSAVLFLVSGCSEKEPDNGPDSYVLARPDVKVRALTSSGFMLQWDVVENAASYTWSIDGGEPVSTDSRNVSFSGLENHTEYVVCVRAEASEGSVYQSSDYTYVHVFTEELLPLAVPELTLGCAYASRTMISWQNIDGASEYEYTMGGKTARTSDTKVSFTDLAKSTEYEFSVKAISADPLQWTDSQASSLTFTTSDSDIPSYLIVPTDVVSDAVAYDIYAVAGDLYYYDVVPAYVLNRLSEDEIITSYRQAILDYAKEQGISLQLALASVLKSGTSSMTKTGLTSEMSYAIIAFGMTLTGDVTSGLSHAIFKTKALGASDGPNFGGSKWFTQTYFLTNSYLAAGYSWMNSVVSLWLGQDVQSIRYRTLPTSSFRQLFPDPSDTEAIKAFLRDERYSYPGTEAHIIGTNSNNGCLLITAASAGVSYTLSTLATVAGGEETLCVNSITTKTDMTDRTWFTVSAVTDESYGPVHNTIGGGMKGVDVTGARFALFESSAIASVPVSDYPSLVERFGRDVSEDNIGYINGGGLAYRFQADPSTRYTFVVTARNSVGDVLTKHASVTTAAAPEEASVRTASRGAGKGGAIMGIPPAGRPSAISPLDKAFFPMMPVMAPSAADANGDDIWTAVHNKKILEKLYDEK